VSKFVTKDQKHHSDAKTGAKIFNLLLRWK
jgi:hypothetical protein